MPRIRSVKPEFFSSATVAKLTLRQMLLFEGLWVYCDDQGRALDDPRLIKGVVWPQRDEITHDDIAADLTELNMLGFIVRYEKNGTKYLQIPTWKKHQRVSHAAKSKYPAPPARSRNTPETLWSLPETLAPEVEVGSGSGSGSGSRNREQGTGNSLSVNDGEREKSRTHFDRFYASYPKHVAKQDAKRAFDKRVKAGADPEDLIAGAERYAAWVKAGGVDSPRFVAHPATWLNRGSEDDELPDPKKLNGRPHGIAAVDAVFDHARRQA